MTPQARSGLRYLAVSVVLFGGIWPITKDALTLGASPLWFAVVRGGLAAIATAALLAPLGRLRLPRRADLPAVGVIGVLQIGVFFALSHLALATLPAGRTAILSNVTIFWLVPLSALLLHERVSPRQWIAAAIGLCGVLVLMGPAAFAGSSAIGYAMLLGASLCWSVSILVTRRFPPRRPILDLLPWCFLLSLVPLLPLAQWRAPGGGVGAAALPHALYIGLVAAPFGTWAVTEVGRRLPAVQSSLGFLVIPTFGLVLATLWLGEPMGWDLVLGGLLIIGSVWLAVRE